LQTPIPAPGSRDPSPFPGAAKVTVVVPNYNHGPFLRRRIESILQQTYRDFEVVILDDASSDNSHSVIEQFTADPRIRFFPSEVNSGIPARQWNRGVREANGEYVWIAESDDRAERDFLETMVARLDAHPNVGLAYCQSCVIDADDNILGSGASHAAWFDRTRWTRDFIGDGRRECSRYLVYRNTIPNASAVLFRRSEYIAAGWADESLRYGHDQLMWARMLLRSDLLFVSRALNYFRRHAGAFGTQTSLRGDPGRFFRKLARTLADSQAARADRKLRAQLHYLRGRRAVCEARPLLARRHFARSLRTRPLATPLVCWISTFFGARFKRAAWKVHHGAPWAVRMLCKLDSL
jgi:GT2 family glycosyltransferase